MKQETKGAKVMKRKDTRLIMESLEVPLTEKELKGASKTLAEALRGKGQVEDELETFKSQKKAEVTRLEGVIAINAQLVHTEKEFRNVECEESFDFTKGIKTTTRLDTGEIIRTDAITNGERQTFMDPALAGK